MKLKWVFATFDTFALTQEAEGVRFEAVVVVIVISVVVKKRKKKLKLTKKKKKDFSMALWQNRYALAFMAFFHLFIFLFPKTSFCVNY